MNNRMIDKCEQLLRTYGSMNSAKLRKKLKYKVPAKEITFTLQKNDRFEQEGKERISDRRYTIWTLRETR